MILDFSQKNLNIVFEVDEDKFLNLIHFSNTPYIEQENTVKRTAVDIQISGENQDQNNGAKYIGTSGSLSLKYNSHNYYENELGMKLEMMLKDNKTEVVLHYQFYKEVAGVRSWTVVTNTSSDNIGLEYVASFTYTGLDEGEQNLNDKMDIYIPNNSWVQELDWKKYTITQLGPFSATKRISISNTGTWSAKEYLPMGCAVNKETNTAFMWQIENNGSWHYELSTFSNMLYLKLSGPTENENHWHKELAPGESFKTVKAFICIGSDFDNALGEITKYRRNIVRENASDKGLPVIFNDYMNCLNADPTEEKCLPLIDRAAQAGAEYYCMDAGWYADGTWWETVGEWQVCEWRFPNGLKKVFDYVREKGMVPGIWIEIEVMGINCPIVDQFTDDCFFMRHGRRVIDRGRYQFDFRNEKVREFATGVIDRLIADYGIGYIKMDYNIDAGTGTEVKSDSFGDGLLGHNRAYLSWIESIMDKYPELIIENCSSGGMRMDYAQLALHTIQSVTDMWEYKKMIPIAAAAATAALPEQAAIWAYPTKESDNNAVVVNMVNAMPLRIHLSGQIMDMDEERFNLVKEGVNCYKKIRADIRKSIPFYPAGLPQYYDKTMCSAYRCKDKTYLCLWCLDEENAVIDIPIKAKNVNILYPSKTDICIKNTGEKLSVSFNKPYTAVFVEAK